MRRFLTSLFLVALAAVALATAASAKDMSVGLASGPPTLESGQPWNAELLVHGVARHARRGDARNDVPRTPSRARRRASTRRRPAGARRTDS